MHSPCDTGYQPVPSTSHGLVARVTGNTCVRVAIAGVLALMNSGCPPKASQRQMYLGPTEPMRDVVQAINQNNDRLPSLWSRGYFEASIVDQGRSHFVNGDLLLLYRRPD